MMEKSQITKRKEGKKRMKETKKERKKRNQHGNLASMKSISSRKDGDLNKDYMRQPPLKEVKMLNVFAWREVTWGHKLVPQTIISWYGIFLNISYISTHLMNGKNIFVSSHLLLLQGVGKARSSWRIGGSEVTLVGPIARGTCQLGHTLWLKKLLVFSQ